jgi:2'-5' RNA ligase
MGKITSSPADDGGSDDPKRKRRPRPARNLATRPARSYHPSAAGGVVGWAGYGSAVLDGKPIFNPLWDVPRMLRDPSIRFGLNQLVGSLTMGQWDIKSKSPEVSGFVRNTVTKFWTRLMPQVAMNYYLWGRGPAVHHFEVQGSGQAVYAGGQWVRPTDATPRVFTGTNEFAGFDLTTGVTNAEDRPYVPPPHAYWMAGAEEVGRFYDWSVLVGAFEPWLEKNTRQGALHSRRLFFRNHAFKGVAIYHPMGRLDVTDDNSPSNRDYALHLADLAENGTNFVFPDDRVPGDGKTDPAWRVETMKNEGAGQVQILDYVKDLDAEVMKGLGIPPELVEAAETGSGWSGRMIPIQGFFNMQHKVQYALWAAFEPAVRDLVSHNYGGEEFTCDPVPLLDTVMKQNSGNPTTALMGQGQSQGQPGTDAQMAGSGDASSAAGGAQSAPAPQGGGDPTAGGLVPYVGPHGGRGKRNPQTGKVYYMGHDGRRYGCLMADLPDEFAAACRAFAAAIPDKELATDGRETNPHCTLRFGLHSLDPTPVLRSVAELGTLQFVPGRLGVFKGDQYDVLYVSCENAHDWTRWHRAVEHLPHTDTHDRYVPHVTLAYLRPGKGKEYLGRDDLAGEPLSVPSVVYATPDGREERCPVWPSAAEVEEQLRELVAA